MQQQAKQEKGNIPSPNLTGLMTRRSAEEQISGSLGAHEVLGAVLETLPR